MRDEAAISALNNAEWCDAVCRAHGVPGSFAADIWTQPLRGPAYYSNAITLSHGGLATQRAAIDALAPALRHDYSVKDAFNCLDLSASGFRALFDAEWVWLDRPPAPPTLEEDSEWVRIGAEAELANWEAAWSAAGSPATTRIFPAALLRDESITFLGAKKDGAFVAGCAANRSTGNVVGFSNFFAPGADSDRFRAAAVAQAALFAPGLPLVGYDRDEALAAMLRLGFRSVGMLRVWVHD